LRTSTAVRAPPCRGTRTRVTFDRVSHFVAQHLSEAWQHTPLCGHVRGELQIHRACCVHVETFVCIQIERREALHNLEEICQVPRRERCCLCPRPALITSGVLVDDSRWQSKMTVALVGQVPGIDCFFFGPGDMGLRLSEARRVRTSATACSHHSGLSFIAYGAHILNRPFGCFFPWHIRNRLFVHRAPSPLQAGGNVPSDPFFFPGADGGAASLDEARAPARHSRPPPPPPFGLDLEFEVLTHCGVVGRGHASPWSH
jgi:hypothetical protein